MAERKPYPEGSIVWAAVYGAAEPCFCERQADGTLIPLGADEQAELEAAAFPRAWPMPCGIGRRVEFRAPDGRTFVVPPAEPPFSGSPVDAVLDIEAMTGTRLRDGGNPCWLIRLHSQFERQRDPAAGVSFAEYVARRHPEAVDRDEPADRLGEATTVDDAAMMSAADLAKLFDVPHASLKKRLDRWRGKRPKPGDGWREVPDRGPRDPAHLYRVGAVRPIVDALKSASGETSGERPAK